jgi:dihydropteroate synthase
MGIINASPESFFKASVKEASNQIASTAKQMEDCGAHLIDIGGMSTAPYLDTIISEEQEISRLTKAIRAAKESCSLPISADTPRAAAAKAAVAEGAEVINDISGLKYDPEMAAVVAESNAKVILCAYSKSPTGGKISGTVKALKESIKIARRAGIKSENILVDPSIGFFRSEGRNPFFTKMTDMPWYTRDIGILSQLSSLGSLKKPICISASRKSFIGHLLNLESPDDRLTPSIVCEVLSVLSGASLVRTHSVKETVQALVMLEMLGGKHTEGL